LGALAPFALNSPPNGGHTAWRAAFSFVTYDLAAQNSCYAGGEV